MALHAVEALEIRLDHLHKGVGRQERIGAGLVLLADALDLIKGRIDTLFRSEFETGVDTGNEIRREAMPY